MKLDNKSDMHRINRAIINSRKERFSMKIATIGSGFIVDHFIQAARRVEGVTFEACYSRSMENAIAFSQKHSIQKSYDSIETMLKDEGIDTVYVASPNSLHYSQTMQCIEAGKHVIVEKPFAGNVVRAKEMFEKAKQNNVYIFEAITTIHLPHFQTIKNSLQSLGPLTLMQANFSQYSSRYDALLKGENPNVFNPEFSGGALADINLYNIHLAVGLFGKPIASQYCARMYKNGIDVSGVVTLQYPNFVCSLVGAKDSVSENFVLIQGEKGWLKSPSTSSMLTKIMIQNQKGSEEINIQDEPQHMYQVKEFKRIVEQKDEEAYEVYRDHTSAVVEVIEEARRCIGMYYEY